MVLTNNDVSVRSRFENFFVWLWGMLYLFFATIFTDPSKANKSSGGQFGNGGSGNKMHGQKKSGRGFMGRGGGG